MNFDEGTRYIFQFSDNKGSWTTNDGIFYRALEPAQREMENRKKIYPKNNYRVIKVKLELLEVIK